MDCQLSFGSSINIKTHYDEPSESTILENVHKRGIWRLLPINNNSVATASYDRHAKIFQISHPIQKASLAVLSAHKSEVLSLGMINKEILVTGGSDGQMFFWDIASGTQKEVIREKKKSATGFYSLKVLNQNLIATGACQRPEKIAEGRTWEHNIKIWDVNNKKTIAELKGHSGGISALDAKELIMISVSADKTLRIWNASSFECLTNLECHKDYIYTATLYDTHYAITGSRDKHIHLIDLETQKIVNSFKSRNSEFAHESTVYHVNLLKDKFFLSSSRDGSVKVWDMREPNPVKCYDVGKGQFAYSVAGLEDGTIIAGTGISKKGAKKQKNETNVLVKNEKDSLEKKTKGSLVIWPQQLFKA